MTNDQLLYDPLYEIIAHVRQVLSDDFDDIYKAGIAYKKLQLDAEEKDESGKLTTKAARARAKLRHPLLFEETTIITRRKIVRQMEKYKKEMTNIFGDALKKYAIFQEYKAKLSEIDRAPSEDLSVYDSRQSHDPESLFALGQPFIEKLARAKASPSAMGRLPENMVECIADLIQAHAKDPHGEDPNNPWNLMVEAGLLEAPARHLTPDQQRVIDHAHRLRSEQQKSFIAEARQLLGLPEGFSEVFLSGVARIADLTRELSRGEGDAFFKCHAMRRDRDIELLAQIVNLDPERDYGRLAAVVDFVRSAGDCTDDRFASRVRQMAVTAFVDRIEPHVKLKSDWIKELVDGLPELAGMLSESVDSIDAFNHLLRSGLEASVARQGFKEREEKREAQKHYSWYQEGLCQALVAGKPFKIDYPFVYSQGSDDFERADGEVWSCDAWIAAHGLPEGFEPAEDDLGDVEILDPNDYDVTYFDADWPASDTQAVPDSNVGRAPDPQIQYAEFDELDPVTVGAGEPEIDSEEIDFEALIREDDEASSAAPSILAVPNNIKAASEDELRGPGQRPRSAPISGTHLAASKALAPSPAGQTGAAPTPKPDYRSPDIAGELPRDGDAQPSLFNINDEDM